MARDLTHVHSEIIRVSNVLNTDPRLLTRSKFLPQTDVTKHDLDTYGGFAKLRADAAHTFGIAPQKSIAESRGVDIRNSYYRKLERQYATADYFAKKVNDHLEDLFTKYPIKTQKPKKVPKLAKSGPERTLTLLWSDLHFGINVDSREVINSEYNWTIAARRMAKLVQQAVEYKPQYRKTTKLQIVLNGDILHGVIHLSEAGIRPIMEQVHGACEILVAAIDYLKHHFADIDVLCLPGNHDRTTYAGRERAVSQRWNAYSHMLYLSIMQAFRGDKNVNFDVPMSGVGSYETVGGHLIMAAHGDTEPSVGNVSKSINVEKIATSIYKMNSNNVFDKKISVALFGHWHAPLIHMLPNGTYILVNGCLIGSDGFAQNGINSYNAVPAQIMFESVKDYAVGDSRIVQVRDADEEADYNKIIPVPAMGLSGGLVV